MTATDPTPTPTPPATPAGIPLWFTLVGLAASFIGYSVFHTRVPIIVGGFIVLGLLFAILCAIAGICWLFGYRSK